MRRRCPSRASRLIWPSPFICSPSLGRQPWIDGAPQTWIVPESFVPPADIQDRRPRNLCSNLSVVTLEHYVPDGSILFSHLSHDLPYFAKV